MLIGESPIMQDLRARVVRVARTDFTVLVEGESGAGKELVGRELHASSPRCRGPFVAVNCAAIVETLVEAELFGIEKRTATGVRGRKGRFEQADRGTLFLDEVADLSPGAQAKLLRVLQDMVVERVGGLATQRVDTRIVAATNRSLRQMVDAGRFREDLYYRLAGVEVHVPPLRVRREDIPLLVDFFLARYAGSERIAISGAAIETLMTYDWPGNVRQLARVLEHAIALAPSPRITPADLPSCLSGLRAGSAPVEADETLRGWSSRYVKLVLDRCLGNKRRACDVLDISYHTLQAHLNYRRSRRRSRRGGSAGPDALPPGPVCRPVPANPLDLGGVR